ncbi:MAG: glycosyltransferase [Desulfosudaceae bacterium]
MNICMFTNTYLPHVGGVANSVATLAADLTRNEHRVLIIAPEYPGREVSQEDVEVFRVAAIQNFNGSDFSVRLPFTFNLKNRIDQFAPDIIHSHHPFLLGDSALRAASQLEIPIVFTHHTLYEQYTHYVPLNSKPMRQFVINLSTSYANLCNRVIAPSRSVADLIKERGVKRPVTAIPTGVDLDFYRSGDGPSFREKMGIAADHFVLGHLGRLAAEKNLDYLAGAVAQSLLRDRQAVFLVIGDGPAADTMTSLFREKGLDDRVFFAGKQTGPAVSDAYNAMDLFVFSSQSETQGMVLAEAMAAGLPVVALDGPGVREVLSDKNNGRLLPENAPPDAFADAIKDFTDHTTREDYSRQALETARLFSRQHCANLVTDLYQSAIDHYSGGQYRSDDDMISWNTLLRSIKTEWDLLSQKTEAVIEAFKPDST